MEIKYKESITKPEVHFSSLNIGDCFVFTSSDGDSVPCIRVKSHNINEGFYFVNLTTGSMGSCASYARVDKVNQFIVQEI